MSAPLISIVLPFFNAAQFLPETLGSVFAQTFTSWELILVDDGSSDASTTVAHECAARSDKQLFYLEHDCHANRGTGPSRNAGIARARGEWIALLDADDVWLPEKLSRQMAGARAHPSAELIFGRAEYWQSWCGGIDQVPEREDLGGLYEPPRLLLATILGDTMPPPPSDVLVRRELWQRVGGFEDAFPRMYEDQVFVAKCMAMATAYVARETWTRYRRHAESMESSAAGDTDFAYQERQRFLSWVVRTFSDHPDPHVCAAVRRLTWPARNPRLHNFLWRTRRALARTRGESPHVR
jgi:glycosyltransferase involved in cell wall biosynthesis